MIILDRVSKYYPMRGGGRKQVLNEVSGVIHRGDAIGILGRNGAGKSTLMRMLGGVEFPNTGRIERRMSVSWPLAAGIGVQSSMSGADNARFVARIYDQPIDRMLRFVEDFAELGPYLYMPVKTYSAGMMSRLLFAMSLAVDFDCYLIDEAAGAGDYRFVNRARQALADRLRNRAIIMVSHSAAHIRSFCRSAAVLHEGALTFFEDVDEAIATYEAL